MPKWARRGLLLGRAPQPNRQTVCALLIAPMSGDDPIPIGRWSAHGQRALRVRPMDGLNAKTTNVAHSRHSSPAGGRLTAKLARVPLFSRSGRRRLAMALSTGLGLAPRGFFIPHRHAADSTAESARRYPAIERLFRAREAHFLRLIEAIDQHASALEAIGNEGPPAPRWRQHWFARLDAAAAYVLVRDRSPHRLVEVGGGHSTRFFARAAVDSGRPLTIAVIDPEPRADLRGLGVERVRTTVQRAGSAPFAGLAAGDVLSVDGSHILMPGTDVDLLLNRVLPELPAGVLVHVHDVFLPDDYPEEWAWRGYNEQLGIAALLQGRGWRVLWSSRYAATRLAARLEHSVIARLDILPGAFESSLWLEKIRDD